ncbi:MAG: M3 family metallopeptidase [Propionibacteriaceae bacterium]|nr:M3 family metallopeptidase [Propionibacteriaceae bacterium]
MTLTNPLAVRSVLPFELPDFAVLTPEHYRSALTEGMAEQLDELAAIAADVAPPTQENVIDAWETSGQLLGRAMLAFFTVKWADTTDELSAIEEEMAPRLAAHADAIYLDPALYRRVVALADRMAAGETALDEQGSYWLERTRQRFERAGIALPEPEQQRLRELNGRIAESQSKFGRLSLAGMNAAAVWVTDVAELDGLSATEIQAAHELAAERGRPEAWLIEIENTTGQRPLDVLTNRALRERIHRAAIGRGLGGEHDTRAVLLELARLRAERAGLLGFANHADYVAADACAKTADAIWERLTGLVPAVVENVASEAAELDAVLQRREPGAGLQPWDWQYLSEILRAERYSLDAGALRPYLEVERVLRDGVFAAANGLYGITFHERIDLVPYHPEVRVFEVREADGTTIGLFLADFFTRAPKQGGAWMNNIVDQNHLLGQLPVVVNNSNLVKPPAGEPALMSWDDVITLFHEFGHSLHGLLSDTRYRSQSGTETPRDFVEYPSQVNEMWALEPSLLAKYAVHVETGEPIPSTWVETLIGSTLFQQGFKTAEYLAAALLDQVWHTTALEELPTDPEQVEEFEKAALAKVGLDLPLVPPRYRSSYFRHTFEGGYDAGYYSYIWSEVLDADTAAWIRASGGLTRENGERYRRRLLARGGSIDVMEAYRDYRGQEPDLTPLLERRGLLR